MEKIAEEARREEIYRKAIAKMHSVKNADMQREAIALFQTIPGFRDADEQITVCEQQIRALMEKENAERTEAERKTKKRKTALIIALAVLAVSAALAVLLPLVILPGIRYARAMALYNAGEYERAIPAFEALHGYRDSEAKIAECRYGAAARLYDAGEYETAAEAFAAPDGDRDSGAPAQTADEPQEIAGIREAKVGDFVTFGAYEQDNDASNGKESIEWLVLEKDSDSELLISRYALDCRPYHDALDDMTWEECSLRAWLNEIFLNDAFSADEQSRILNTLVGADRNPSYTTTPAGNDTEDRVFLLSIPEAVRYMDPESARQCEPTAYANAQSGFENICTANGHCLWWLRSPGIRSINIAIVDSTGCISLHGYSVDHANTAVRPAIRIDVGDS